MYRYDLESQKTASSFLGSVSSNERNRNEFERRDYIDPPHADEVHFYGFHYSTVSDDGTSIRAAGLRSLTELLSHESRLSNLLRQARIVINPAEKTITTNGTHRSIDPLIINGLDSRSLQWRIAHRLYKDSGVTGFAMPTNPYDYTCIAQRPEFLEMILEYYEESVRRQIEKLWNGQTALCQVKYRLRAIDLDKGSYGFDEGGTVYRKEKKIARGFWEKLLSLAWQRENGFDSSQYFVFTKPQRGVPASCIDRVSFLPESN